MPSTGFRIRHGQFHDVDGRPQRREEITFVPARVTLDGTSFQSVCDLADMASEIPADVRAAIHPGDDAPWVLASHLWAISLPVKLQRMLFLPVKMSCSVSSR